MKNTIKAKSGLIQLSSAICPAQGTQKELRGSTPKLALAIAELAQSTPQQAEEHQRLENRRSDMQRAGRASSGPMPQKLSTSLVATAKGEDLWKHHAVDVTPPHDSIR